MVAQAGASGESSADQLSGKRRVLIVEDEGLIALDLKRRLERAGYLVPASATTAEDAVMAARNHHVDVVLMDIRLAGPRDGIDAANELRREFNLPVLFVTAHADRATIERARLAEPFGYILKPFTATNFEPKIEIAIWKHAMEKRLRESERWLSETMRHAGDGILTAGKSGNVATVNPAAESLLNREASQLIGHHLCDVVSLKEAATGDAIGRERLDALLSSATTLTALLANGGIRAATIECTLAPNSENGAPLGLIVILRDISARLKAAEEEKQRQKLQALSLLATGAGRELQEPLRTIASHTEECMQDARGAALRELRQIYRATSQAQTVAQQLLQMGRTEEPEAETVEVNSAIEYMQPRLRKLFSRKQALRFALGRDLPPILVDRPGFDNALMTLTIGAQRAAGSQGTVEVATGLGPRNTVWLSISDSGTPIPERSRGRVFEPYYHSRAGQPEGLSLALVHHFATIHGGTIESSVTASGSASFRLSFPARAEGGA